MKATAFLKWITVTDAIYYFQCLNCEEETTI